MPVETGNYVFKHDLTFRLRFCRLYDLILDLVSLIVVAELWHLDTLFVCSGCREKLPPCQDQIGQVGKHINLANVLGQAT